MIATALFALHRARSQPGAFEQALHHTRERLKPLLEHLAASRIP